MRILAAVRFRAVHCAERGHRTAVASIHTRGDRMNTAHVLMTLAAMAAVTFVLRALPFVAEKWLNKHRFVERLGQFCP